MEQIELFKDIDDNQLNSFIKKTNARKISFKKDMTIMSNLKNTNDVGVVLKGETALLRIDYNGNRTIVSNYVKGDIPALIEEMELVTEEVLKYDNAHVFCFYDDTDVITNLDNYSDLQHYSGEVLDMILRAMASGEHELTRYNYKEYLESVKENYMNYDYSWIGNL